VSHDAQFIALCRVFVVIIGAKLGFMLMLQFGSLRPLDSRRCRSRLSWWRSRRRSCRVTLRRTSASVPSVSSRIPMVGDLVFIDLISQSPLFSSHVAPICSLVSIPCQALLAVHHTALRVR
jgi:hypothetical protein